MYISGYHGNPWISVFGKFKREKREVRENATSTGIDCGFQQTRSSADKTPYWYTAVQLLKYFSGLLIALLLVTIPRSDQYNWLALLTYVRNQTRIG